LKASLKSTSEDFLDLGAMKEMRGLENERVSKKERLKKGELNGEKD